MCMCVKLLCELLCLSIHTWKGIWGLWLSFPGFLVGYCHSSSLIEKMWWMWRCTHTLFQRGTCCPSDWEWYLQYPSAVSTVCLGCRGNQGQVQPPYSGWPMSVTVERRVWCPGSLTSTWGTSAGPSSPQGPGMHVDTALQHNPRLPSVPFHRWWSHRHSLINICNLQLRAPPWEDGRWMFVEWMNKCKNHFPPVLVLHLEWRRRSLRGLASGLMSLDIAWVLTSSRNDKILEIESTDKMKKLEVWSDLLKVSQSSQVHSQLDPWIIFCVQWKISRRWPRFCLRRIPD